MPFWENGGPPREPLLREAASTLTATVEVLDGCWRVRPWTLRAGSPQPPLIAPDLLRDLREGSPHQHHSALPPSSSLTDTSTLSAADLLAKRPTLLPGGPSPSRAEQGGEKGSSGGATSIFRFWVFSTGDKLKSRKDGKDERMRKSDEWFVMDQGGLQDQAILSQQATHPSQS